MGSNWNQTPIISPSDYLSEAKQKDRMEMLVVVQVISWSEGLYLLHWIPSVIWETATGGSGGNDKDTLQYEYEKVLY